MQLKKLSLVLSYFFIGLILFISTTLILIILLLQSPSGNIWLTKTLSSFLYQKNIILQAEDVHYSLPKRLTVKKLSLADKNGVWLKLKYADISINPWELFKGILNVTLLEITNISLERLPILDVDTPQPSIEFFIPSIPSLKIPWWINALKIEEVKITNTSLDASISGIPLNFSILGNLSSTGWESQLSIESPAFSKLTGYLNVTTDPSLLNNAQIPWNVSIQIESTPHNVFFTGFFEQPLTANALLYSKQGYLILEKISAISEPWHLIAKDIELIPGSIHGQINITNTGGTNLPSKIRPISLDINLSGTFKNPIFDLDLLFKETTQYSLQTTLQTTLDLQKNKAHISTTGNLIFTNIKLQNSSTTNTVQIDTSVTPKEIHIKNVSCNGPLIDISFSGEINTLGTIATTLTANIPNLQNITSLFSLNTPLSGEGLFDIDIKRNAPHTPINGIATIHLKKMDWGTQIFQGLLNSETKITSSFALASDSNKDIEINTITLTSKNIQGKGSFTLKKEQIKTAILLDITNLAETDLPITGDITLSMDVQGTLTIPDITLTFSSPKITLYTLEFDEPKFQIKTTNATSSKSQGSIALSTTKTSPHTLTLSTNWICSEKELLLPSISGNILGIFTQGALSLQRSDGLVEGKLTTNVHSWNELENLLQTTLSGKISMETIFDPQKDQSISNQLNIDLFSTTDLFFLKNLTNKFTITNLKTTPQLTFLTNIDSGNYNLLQWDKGNIKLVGTPEHLNLNIEIKGSTLAQLALEFNTKKQHIHLETFRIEFPSKESGIILNQPTDIYFSQENFLIKNLILTLNPSGSISTTAFISPQKLDFQTTLTNISLSILDPILNTPLQGTLSSTIKISGTPLHPKGTIDIHATNIQTTDTTIPLSFTINGALKDIPYPILKLNMNLIHNNIQLPAIIAANIPIDFTKNNLPIISKKNPLTAKIDWKGELETLWQFVPIADTYVSGQGTLSASLEGTLTNPSYQIQASIDDATYTDLAQGIQLETIKSKLNLNPQGLSHLFLTVSKNQKDQVKIIGTIGPENTNFPITILGIFTEFNPLKRKDLDITISGKTNLTGTLKNSLLTGNITVTKGALNLISSPDKNIPTLNTIDINDIHQTSQNSSNNYLPKLNLQIHIPNHFFVHGTNLESEWSGALELKNTLSNPQITGRLISLRGIFSFLGKDFSFTDSTISFTGSTPPIPVLNINLTYKSATITAITTITGSTTKPTFKLSSIPSLPQDEIVAQVLFGQNTQNLTKIQLLQLANELAQITGFSSGNNNILDKTKKIAGVDILRISSVSKKNSDDQVEETPVLEIGQRLTNFIYLGVEQGVGSNSSNLRIEVELNNNLMLEGRTGPQTNEIGINWKKDY